MMWLDDMPPKYLRDAESQNIRADRLLIRCSMTVRGPVCFSAVAYASITKQYVVRVQEHIF